MINLKKISVVALLATLALGYVPFAYAMEKEDQKTSKDLPTLPFRDIKVERGNNELLVRISIEEGDKGYFRRLTSLDETREIFNTLIQAYNTLPEDENKTTFRKIKISKMDDDEVVFKEAESDDPQPSYRHLPFEEVSAALLTMFNTYTNVRNKACIAKMQDSSQKPLVETACEQKIRSL